MIAEVIADNIRLKKAEWGELTKQWVEPNIWFYNEKRLHSALFYLTPKKVFEGKIEQRLEERQKG